LTRKAIAVLKKMTESFGPPSFEKETEHITWQ